MLPQNRPYVPEPALSAADGLLFQVHYSLFPIPCIYPHPPMTPKTHCETVGSNSLITKDHSGKLTVSQFL
jgi:hypothetical protein